MREILFKGKRVDNGKWVYGDFQLRSLQCFIVERGTLKKYKVIPESVSEFTGLIDRNGTRVFEGDICISEETTLKIVWNENMHSWHCEVLISKCPLVDKKTLFPLWHWELT